MLKFACSPINTIKGYSGFFSGAARGAVLPTWHRLEGLEYHGWSIAAVGGAQFKSN
jgi:hypothetical protein